jgi:phosphoribosylformylglycinamidine cyclo-ligase
MRVVPRGRSLRIDWGAWGRPPIFSLIQRLGEVPEEDMRRAFNLGIGLIVIVPLRCADKVLAFLRKKKDPGIILGEVV